MKWFLNLINRHFIQRTGEYIKHVRCFRLDMLLVDNKQQLTLNLGGNFTVLHADFWERNVALLCSDVGFQLLNSPESSLSYFSFHDVPNQVWLNRSGLQPSQYLDTFTTKPCPCNSSSMGFSTVLPKYCMQQLPLKGYQIWMGAYVALISSLLLRNSVTTVSKTFKLAHLQVFIGTFL